MILSVTVWALGGYLTQQDIQKNLYANIEEIQSCLQRLSTDSGLTIEMSIEPQGRSIVKSVVLPTVSEDKLPDSHNDLKCITAVIENVSFSPAPETLDVTWKVILKDGQVFPLSPVVNTSFGVQLPGLLHRKESLSTILNYLTAKGEAE